MDINVNVRITADDNLVNALSDIAGCMAVIAAAKAGRPDLSIPDKTVKQPQAEETVPVKEKKPAETAQAPAGEPVSPKEAKAIRDIVSTPSAAEEKKQKELPPEDPDKKVAGDKLLALREAVKKFVEADSDTNRPKLKSWLNDHQLIRVPDATNAQAAELMAYMQEGGKASA